MPPSLESRSAFVPHDLAKPVAGAASGPLAGLRAVVKDMYDMMGERTGSGNPDWLQTQNPATRNAGVIDRILSAGATITNKTVCDEFFFSVTGINAHYGMPVNPRAPGRIPGGSSSGSASATASGACDFALGSDTGGSVRVPASFCGIYGLRPTLGRVDLSGVQGMAHSFDVPGWFAGGPGVFRKVGDVVLDQRRFPASIDHVLVIDDAFAQADEDVARMLRAGLEFMQNDLPAYVHAHIAPDGFDGWRECFRIIQAYEVWETFGPFVQKHHPGIGPGVRERIEFSSTLTKAQVEEARKFHARAREHIVSHVPPGTVLALPTAPCIAPTLNMSAADLESFRVRVMRLTCIAGIGGLPQVNIPIGTVAGCPAGLSFIGWAGGDEALLDLAVKAAPYCGITG